ncbi:unnamed protein product [Ectocarpus fasciculatus]
MDMDVGGGVRASGTAITKNGLDASSMPSPGLPQTSSDAAADSTAAGAALSSANGSKMSAGAAVVPASGGAWSRVANATSPEKDDAGGKGVTTGVAKGSPPTPSVVGAGGATPAAAGGKPRLDWGMGAVSAGFVPSYSAEAASSPQTASAVAVLPGESPGAPAPAAVGGGTADAAPTQPPTLQKRGSRRLGWGMGIGSKLSADEKATEAAAALAAEKAAAEKAEADKAAAAKKAADEAAAAAAVAAAPPKALHRRCCARWRR